MRPILCALSLLPLSVPAAAQIAEHPLQDCGTVEYVFTIGERELGRETVTFRTGGWDATGHHDLGKEVSYAARWTVKEGRAGVWHIEGNGGPVFGSYTCDWEDDAIAITVIADGKVHDKSTSAWEHENPPVFFENLVWSVFSEAAARLGEWDERVLQFFTPQNGESFDATIKVVGERTWLDPSGQALELRELELELGGLTAQMTCTRAGLLLHLRVPVQQLVVARVGYEGVAPIVKPKTIVDSGAWREQLSAPQHEFTIEEGLRVKLRDDVELAVDVYRPAIGGRVPTILVRTPYNRKNEGLAGGAYFARRGYACVVQDVRGRFESDGAFVPIAHEERDGSDTLDWIAAQEWSDGNVGMIGGSYVGWVQWYAAASGNEHLKCIVPQVSPPDPLENFPYEGGAFLLGVAWWAVVLEHMDAGGAGVVPDIDFWDLLATLPLGDLDKAFGVEKPFLDEWLAHPPSDLDYWRPLSYQHRFGEMSVPALHITGWYDGDQPGALQNFPGMQAGAKTARARDGQFLVVGPWGHGFNMVRRMGDVDFGPQAVIDLDAVELRFFDHYLKGIDNGLGDAAPVHAFVMGANDWVASDTWPLAGTQFTQVFVDSGGNARTRDGDGRLTLTPPVGVARDTFVYDPRSLPDIPVDIDWGDVTGAQATLDMSTFPDREDVLKYTSAPVAEAVEIVGPVEVRAWIASDARDTDLVAGLSKIEKDGAIRRVAGGIQRVRYRGGPGTDAPVAPGTPAEVTVDCWATGLRLEKGERLLLELSSNAFPGYARNLNTLEDPSSSDEVVVATNAILHDAEHPTHVVLPIVPRKGAGRLRFDE